MKINSKEVVNNPETIECHGKDSPDCIRFYENEYYVFSNFSSFQMEYKDLTFATSEHLYHWLRFILANTSDATEVAIQIRHAKSAHEAYKLAQEYKHLQVSNWDEIKEEQMEMICTLKAEQHEYVMKKLIQSYPRKLSEDSWKDDYWGSGADGNGRDALGKIWMRIRDRFING